jgi:hypothetical protein
MSSLNSSSTDKYSSNRDFTTTRALLSLPPSNDLTRLISGSTSLSLATLSFSEQYARFACGDGFVRKQHDNEKEKNAK